jgi:hypothetical protein
LTAVPATRRPPRRLSGGVGGYELAALALLFALSIAVLVALLARVWLHGGVVTGSDGFLVVDQLQYLNWIRQAGDHLAVANLYDTAPSAHVFVHPGVVISGLFHRAGLGLVASYMIWKPVAVGALFAGALLYVRRFVDRRGDRLLALAVALFMASPIAAVVGWSHLGGPLRKFQFDFLSNEMWPGNYLWGYLFTAIAVALIPLGLLAYERGGARKLALAAVCGAFAAWLQPWQGATFAGIVVVTEAILCLRARHGWLAAARRAAPVVALTGIPLAYYFVLSRYDAAWKLAKVANAFPRWPWWVTVIGLAPLALPALFAYRLPARRFGEVALRAWPIVALVVFYQPFGTFPFHAFQGLALPLAVLAVVAVRAYLRGRPLPWAPAVAAAAVLILPGTAYEADQMASAHQKGLQPFVLTSSEHDALAYLSRTPERGGVLAPVYMGLLVPAYTGRQTWVGAGSWTPDFDARRAAAERLFAGRLSPATAAALVRRSRARFLLSDCHRRADIGRIVAGFAGPPIRFGCATVYRVRR